MPETFMDKLHHQQVWKHLVELANNHREQILINEVPHDLLIRMASNKQADGLWVHGNIDGRNEHAVFIDKALKGNYRNFVLAHELGHALLHTKIINMASYSADEQYHSQIEDQADRYGLRLLRLLERKIN